MNYRKSFVFTFLSCMVLLAGAAYAENQVLGEVEINGASKVEKTSGVWVDGQYVGYVKELKGDRKLLLLPGDAHGHRSTVGLRGLHTVGYGRAGHQAGAQCEDGEGSPHARAADHVAGEA